jgi:hypothetical protein
VDMHRFESRGSARRGQIWADDESTSIFNCQPPTGLFCSLCLQACGLVKKTELRNIVINAEMMGNRYFCLQACGLVKKLNYEA